jgi:hypothetical protein
VKTVYFKVGQFVSSEEKASQEEQNSLEEANNSTAEGSDDDSDNSVEGMKAFPDKIGAYSLDMRSKKILKYKSKIQKRRTMRPISKVFKGRSQVASQKVRVNGKFVKSQ